MQQQNAGLKQALVKVVTSDQNFLASVLSATNYNGVRNLLDTKRSKPSICTFLFFKIFNINHMKDLQIKCNHILSSVLQRLKSR